MIDIRHQGPAPDDIEKDFDVAALVRTRPQGPDARLGLRGILRQAQSPAGRPALGARSAMEVTLSRKRAKTQTRGRKLHSTEAKARVARAPKTRAELEQELQACRREIAHARERLAEATMQQSATYEMLRLISNSPIQSVLDKVAEHAARLCDASNARIWRLEENLLRLAASYGESSATLDGREGLPADRDTVTGRAACDRRTIHVRDISAEVIEYPVGSRIVKGEGWRTTLATPLLREGTPIGVILVRRMEVRPFSEKQIALLETFADQAAIAIENERLFETEQQRTLALAHANRDLAEREARIRRLVDSNIIGIFITGSKGRVLEANDAFLHLVGHDRDDLVSGRIRWTDLTPPEWRERDRRALAELGSNAIAQPYEKEFFRKDGSRVPVLIGGALFEEGANEGVAFVLDLTDRKRAEEALREREAKIRRLVDSNIIGIFIWDFDGRILEANDEFLRMLNYDREDLVAGRIRWADLTPPDWRDRNNARIEQQKSSGRFEPFEKEFTRKDGSRVPILIGGATFEEGGNQGVAFVLDLTERKRAEDALREREAQLAEARRELRQMIDTIPIPVASYSADARRDFVNVAWKQYTGLSDEAALDTEWSVVAHPDHIAASEKMWRDALAAGDPWHTEERVRRADGQYRWFAIDRVAARDENGKIIKWYGTAYDIEDRKRAEERLRVQHTVAQILAEAATIEGATPRILWAMGECLGWDVGALWRADPEAEALRCIELWHKASIEVPEFERASREFTFVPGLGLPGRVWSSLEPEYVPDVVLDENFPRGPIAEREGLHAAFGFPILLGGEVLGVIEFFSREIRQPDQEMLNMLATIGSQIGQFIERKRAEEAFRRVQMQLEHANRVATMGQLSASITHEVNQPITAAVTYALAARRFLSADPPNFREVDDALSLIVKEGNRAGEVIGRIRALIKKVPARRDSVEINDAILEIIGLTRAEAANNSVSVRTQLAEGLPPVLGDRVQLQQVLLNLIINAIEAMRDVDERELLISSRNEPDGVSVEVRDSGPGFTPAALERVFEAFYTTKPDGLGLGLSICRSIIEAHNGRLWASPNVPRGALFGFIAPAHPDVAS
jgi:PAS domain S-box-containing protein